MLTLVLASVTVSRPAIFFGAVERVHTSAQTGSVKAKFQSTDSTGTTSRNFEIKYRWPSEVRLREFDAKNQLIHDRSVSTDKVTDYDPVLEQYTVSGRGSGVSIGGALASIDSSVDDLLLTFTDPSAMHVWLDPLRGLNGWSVMNASKTVDAKFTATDKTVLLSVEKGTARVVRVTMTSPSSKIDWQLSYNKTVTGLTFVKPPLASRVSSFDKQMLPPKFASKEAAGMGAKMFSAYEGLSSFGYVVRRPDGKTTVLLSGKFARQEDDKSKWTYDGNTLVMKDVATNKWYRANMSFSGVIEATAALGTRVDPTLRLLMTGYNPYRKRLGDEATVRLVGETKVKGEDVSLLASVSKNAMITLAVRKRDGLVVNSIARANVKGDVGSQVVELAYDYFEVPSDATKKYALLVPKGTTVSVFPVKPKTN